MLTKPIISQQNQLNALRLQYRFNSMKSKLRNYEIQSKLGSGSYGVIYKAINRSDKSICVLKQIKLTTLNEKAKKNAVNEATILGKLCHPFIVQYIDSFIEQGSLNIIMEYCNGGDLAQFLKLQSKKPLKQQKIWKLFLQICIGLQHIHQRKILHRDIKSLNIFLHQEDVKIGDLGVAKMLEQRDFAQTMVGTPFYLSPQLCQQKPYNEKSDIWALGCLLYELCTFKHPFEAANQASLILKIIRGKYNPIPQFYSKELKELIDSCLQRDYKRRPTCQMILAKPKIKDFLSQFRLDEVKAIEKQILNLKLDQKQNSKEKMVKQKEKKDLKKQQVIHKNPIQSKNFVDKSNQIAQPQTKSNQNKNISVNVSATPKNQVKPEQVKRPQVPLPKKQQIFKRPQIPLPKKPESARKQRQKVSQTPIVSQAIPKQGMLLSQKELPPPPTVKKNDKIERKLESKKDFMNNIDKYLQKQTEVNKKPSIYWQIAAKNNEQVKQSEKMEKPSLINKYQAPKEVVTKVKMQKVIQPKVYDSSKNIVKSKGIIKSGGFLPEDKQVKKPEQLKQLFGRKPSQSQALQKYRVNNDQIKQSRYKDNNKNEQFKSERNLNSNAISSSTPINFKERQKIQPQRYFARRNSQNGPQNLPPRVRKGSHNQMARNVQIISQRNNVTKQERQEVKNLPNMMKNDSSDSSESEQAALNENKGGKITTNSKFKFKLKDVDQNQILQKYQDILKSQKNVSQRIQTNEVSNEQGDNVYQGEHSKSQQFEQEIIVQQNIGQIDKFNQEFNVEIPLQQQIQDNFSGSQENYSNLYQINKFNLAQQEIDQKSLQNAETLKYEQNEQKKEDNQYQAEQLQQRQESQWDFDAQPQLPMLQQNETPCFQQANPYLVDQKQEQESIEDKKNYLQIKLQQNLKREDQINQLMQIKINQCKAVVPKGFQEILDFFRLKLNTDQYTEQDEKDIDAFLKKKGLTDHRKFQNIYKIMHFQMQLQNTRKIIEKLCKKLSQLQCC